MVYFAYAHSDCFLTLFYMALIIRIAADKAFQLLGATQPCPRRCDSGFVESYLYHNDYKEMIRHKEDF